MSALVGILVVVAILLFFAGLQRLTEPGLGTQLPRMILGDEEAARVQGFIPRSILPTTPALVNRFDFLRPLSESDKMALKLEYAGRPYNMDTEQFFGFQIYMMMVGGMLGMLYAVFGIVVGGCGWPTALILLPIAGFFYPRLWLNQKVKQRQDAINLSMPDFLDMLVISVQAGMGFDNALRLVTKHIEGPLSEEIRRLLRELDIGEPRADAFRRLVFRNTSEDLRVFVDALLQAEELGTPIAQTLEVQADELRTRRVHRARDRAAQASPNISLVTIFLIVPSILCLLITMLGLTIVGSDFTGLSP